MADTKVQEKKKNAPGFYYIITIIVSKAYAPLFSKVGQERDCRRKKTQTAGFFKHHTIVQKNLILIGILLKKY